MRPTHHDKGICRLSPECAKTSSVGVFLWIISGANYPLKRPPPQFVVSLKVLPPDSLARLLETSLPMEGSMRSPTRVVVERPVVSIILLTAALTGELHACTYSCIGTSGKKT